MPESWPDSNAIASCFERGRRSYSKSHAFHKRLAESLMEHWPHEPGDGRILEIGSHSGLLTKMLRKKWPERYLITMDLQRGGTGEGFHLCGDGERPPFSIAQFGAVVSGSTFQWFREEKVSIERLLDLLPAGGVLGFTQFLQPSLEPLASEMMEVAGPGRFLPLISIDKLKEMVEPLGKVLHFECLKDTFYFPHMKEMHRFLKDMGVGAPSRGLAPLSTSGARELMSRMEAHRSEKGLPLSVVGVVVWLDKY